MLTGLMMRLGVVVTCTRDQGEELIEMQGWPRKMATAQTSKSAHKPYQDSRNQTKRIATPAAQQKSIRHRRISSGSRSGHSSQTPGGSNAKFLGQREHAGPSRPLLLHNNQLSSPTLLHSDSSFPAPMSLERTQNTSLQSMDIVSM